MDTSVIICAYNPPADFLERTLQSLRDQTRDKANWELLIIDNNSDEPVAESFDLSWHPYARVIVETKQGQTAARLRGINESSTEYIVFIDQDNILNESYLENAVKLLSEHTKLGAIGASVIKPEFEVEPEEWQKPFLNMLALRECGCDLWGNSARSLHVPWGAGLVVRREVALEYVKLIKECPLGATLGRTGKQLLSGDDDGFSWAACTMGMGCGIFKDLSLIHLMPASRLSFDYLTRLSHGHGFSQSLNGFKYGYKPEKMRSTVTEFSQLWKLLTHLRLLTFISSALNYRAFCRLPEKQRAVYRAYNRGIDDGDRWLEKHKTSLSGS